MCANMNKSHSSLRAVLTPITTQFLKYYATNNIYVLEKSNYLCKWKNNNSKREFFGTHKHLIYLLWFQTKPEEFEFQVRVGNQQFHQFTMGFITMTRFNSGFELNPGLKPS